METHRQALRLAVLLAGLATVAVAADNRKQFRYTAGPGSHVSIRNEAGPVVVRPSSGRQVLIVATTHSDSVEVDATQTGNRIEVSTHFLKPVSGDDARVEYEVSIPVDAHITVRAPSGPIQVERLRSDMNLEGDSARIEVRDVANGHVHARTMNGSVLLNNVGNGHVEVVTVSGDVQLNSVNGPSVTVTSTKGAIRVNSDFAGTGSYTFTNSSGDIELTMPANASVALKANSARGTVENDFPFSPDPHRKGVATASSLLGTSNAGASSVTLRSLSGRIRVKKR